MKPGFATDLLPGLTTSAVVVPKALAYATIAQLPVQAGLFAALVPVEAMRQRMAGLTGLPARVELDGDDALAALGIFLIVVAATFPVVLPFAFLTDVDAAKWTSRILSLAMLFGGGLVLGRYAGYGSWKAGLLMTGLGVALTIAIVAFGG